MMPKDENELRHMMKTALEYNDGPIAYRYPRINVPGVPLDEKLVPIPIGSWEMLREGEGLVIMAVGPMVQVAEEAAEMLKREGIQAAVVNARFLKPLDDNMLLSLARRPGKMIVLEEASQAGSLGSAVLEFYAEHGLSGLDISLMGVPDRFIEHGSIKEQLQEVGLTAENVVGEVLKYRSGQQFAFGKKAKPF